MAGEPEFFPRPRHHRWRRFDAMHMPAVADCFEQQLEAKPSAETDVSHGLSAG